MGRAGRYLLVLFGLFLAGLAMARAVSEDELLTPEQAFVVTATVRDAATVVAEWSIAEGYYLYRERFRFTSGTAGVRLGEPRFPPGAVKEDEFFGRMEIYRQRVRIEIPLFRAAAAPARLALKTVSQGCADLGICYPPQVQTLVLDWPPPTRADPWAVLAARPGAVLLEPSQPALLEAEQAFIPSLTAVDSHTLEARWSIAEGYYLYKDKLKLSLPDASGSHIDRVEKPSGVLKEDEFFGRQEVYYHEARLTARLQGALDSGREIHVRLDYQGCAEAGVCYPPMTQTLPVFLAAAPAGPVNGTAAPVAEPPAAPVAEQDRMARLLAEKRFLATPAFFGFGLLLALTPCVFPMIPILSSLIVGQGRQLNQRRAFLLSLTYVLAMAVTYTAAGVLAALLGQNIQALFQNPWVLVSFSLLFVLLALSMFGCYELQLPVRWQTRLAELSNRQRSGSYLGVAAMGLLSALIVGPCVAPPLIGALTVIATTGDALLGGAALFALSLGMGAPLLLIGASAGRWLPRAGLWMARVKAVFGVLLLAVAIWMLERILPAAVGMLLWAVLLIVSATYLGAFQPLERDTPARRILVKGLSVVLLIYGILLLVGVAAGSRDAWQPLRGSGLLAAGETHPKKLAFRPIKTVSDLDQELRQATGRPVLLDFYADWCISCKELEKYTFSDPQVRTALSAAVLLQADVTANDAADRALLRRFGVMGPPAILFFDSQGSERKAYRVVGFMPADRFKTHLDSALRP